MDGRTQNRSCTSCSCVFSGPPRNVTKDQRRATSSSGIRWAIAGPLMFVGIRYRLLSGLVWRRECSNATPSGLRETGAPGSWMNARCSDWTPQSWVRLHENTFLKVHAASCRCRPYNRRRGIGCAQTTMRSGEAVRLLHERTHSRIAPALQTLGHQVLGGRDPLAAHGSGVEGKRTVGPRDEGAVPQHEDHILFWRPPR